MNKTKVVVTWLSCIFFTQGAVGCSVCRWRFEENSVLATHRFVLEENSKKSCFCHNLEPPFCICFFYLKKHDDVRFFERNFLSSQVVIMNTRLDHSAGY